MTNFTFPKSLDAIEAAFAAVNVPIRLVGGCVRDMLLDKTPKDFDLTTPATPDEIRKILDDAKIQNFDLSNGHGTITAMIDGEGFEITTLRQDLETDGRHAVVGFTTDWKIDAERRDFTFNAMSMDFDGTLHDYFNGEADLYAGKVRFVGDAKTRIQEDFLRILRFFRFTGRMDCPEVDYKTLAVIKDNAKGLQNISGERVWMEMKQIMTGEYVQYLLELMDASTVSDHINVSFRNVSIPASKDPITVLAGIIDTSSVESTIERWKLSSQEQKQLHWLVKFRDVRLDIKQLKSLVLNGDDKSFVMELMKIQLREKDFQTMKAWIPEVFPVTGKDLIAVGVNPGPEMGKLLKAMKDEWIASDCVKTREELLEKK